MEQAEKTAGIKPALNFGSEDFDVFIISVSTHQPDDIISPQLDGEATKDGALVSIESTIPRRISNKVADVYSILP
jgi:hypothetical protein